MGSAKSMTISNISFSPDGKKVLFDCRKKDYPSGIHVYNLETGELSAYRSVRGEYWSHARYSFDGKRIVFLIEPLKDKGVAFDNIQLAVMDPDGRNLRTITHSKGFKAFPSFSHSGSKVIFAIAGRYGTSRSVYAIDFDISEVDVSTGVETRLTDIKFGQMSAPYFFPDDKRFIFWGEFPYTYSGLSGHLPADIERMCRQLKSEYQDNMIYLMQANETKLKPYLVHGKYSSKPVLSADGSVLIFRGWAHKPDGQGDGEQFYQYSPDGNHRRITHLDALRIWSQAVSQNGELLAVIYEPFKSPDVYKIVIYKVKDGTSREIVLPDQPSHIINDR